MAYRDADVDGLGACARCRVRMPSERLVYDARGELLCPRCVAMATVESAARGARRPMAARSFALGFGSAALFAGPAC
jgi:hypothetical protein